MPLHLLGKKSWNVYNADNIARVRRDEAAAKAAEEAEEQRMQEVDAERRLAILRGEVPPPIDAGTDDTSGRDKVTATTSHDETRSRTHRKRKRYGEDDTDFELRLAREKNEGPRVTIESTRKPTSSAPIVDRAGHIDLFGDERSRAHAEKNEEAERESRKKKKEYEDQYTMRFSNAAGKDGLNRPWYSQADMDTALELPPKNVWGNEDPRRKERDARRLAVNDPLAMMKVGAAKVRELKQERKKAQEEQEEELRRMKRDHRHARDKERHERDRRRRHDSPEENHQRERRGSRDERLGDHEGHSKRRRREYESRYGRDNDSSDHGSGRHRR
ncbi:hypothetical protein HIM_00049 [Hirsutella minnesotensis 3608]|nr:hypothetical protein HIM_00049 [Hirsutella minnesotensis 3608]